MTLTQDRHIGEIVAEDYRTASVFKSFGIDFCCKGNRSIAEVCEKNEIEPNKLMSDLNEVINAKSDGKIDHQAWPLDLLADYIEKKHHRYVDNAITVLKPYLDKICKVHGNHHPELFEINELFLGSADELTTHMKKEEMILFPFVRKMVTSKELGKPHFGTI